jgi:predicted GNAT family N-acyltransferase
VTRFEIRIGEGEAPAEARAVRFQVFVEEQGVAREEEWDAYDAAGAAAWHFVLLDRESGQAVACARLRAYGTEAKVERVAVLAEQRGLGLGRGIMEAAERTASEHGYPGLLLHAQLPVVPFYERLGWRAEGPEFSEAGMGHRLMRKVLRPSPP